jgi:hypothetical protein
MSDEPKKATGKWLLRALAVLIALASYETTHYATASWISAMRTDRVCVIYDRHVIGGKPAPEWIERLFWPAEWIDEHFRSDRRPWNQWRGD